MEKIEINMENINKQMMVHQGFINQMVIELNKNDKKGDWLEFEDIDKIWDEIFHHSDKLIEAEVSKNIDLIKEHIADIANLYMILGNAYDLYK